MTDAGSPASLVRSIDARPGDDPPVRLLLHNMAVVISRAPHDPRRRDVAVAGSDGAGRIIADRRINRAVGALVIAPRRDLARGGQRSGLVEAGLGPVGRSPAELVAAGRVWTRDAGHVADALGVRRCRGCREGKAGGDRAGDEKVRFRLHACLQIEGAAAPALRDIERLTAEKRDGANRPSRAAPDPECDAWSRRGAPR